MKKNMMKMFGLSVATLFVANVALADNLIDIEQVGPTNTAQTKQEGDGNIFRVDQANSSGTNTIDSFQDGDNNKVTDAVVDTTTTNNTFVVRGADNSSAMQKTTGGNNSLTVRQNSNDNEIGLNQDSLGSGSASGAGSGNNTANFVQSGGDKAVVIQSAGFTSNAGSTIWGNNDIDVDQLGSATNNAYNHQINLAAGNSYTICQNSGTTCP